MKQHVYKGRGATLSPDNRYLDQVREVFDDGWRERDPAPARVRTCLSVDTSRSVISYNQSPDVPIDRSINPYRGCEHGCVYCFARPSHAYLDLSPGLDFESRLFYKPKAPELLREALAARTYRCAPIAVGINTDAYQPVERQTGLTRRILEVLVECGHPFTIVTKSALVERDLDVIGEAAAHGRAAVALSLTTLDAGLARQMEPRAASPARRLRVMRTLSEAGIPVSVFVAPLIPALTDHEMEDILQASREAGALHAGYILLRLPHELKAMFRDWLAITQPLRATHVMQRIRDARGGRDYDATFGGRMRGSGVFAELIARRFRLASRRLGFSEAPALCREGFKPPARGGQLNLL